VRGRLEKLTSRIEDLVFRDARARLARILLQLAAEFGERQGEWLVVEIGLTQSDLARLIGTTRQTTNAVIQELTQEKLVARERGRLVLLRPAELQRISEQGA
jgi:CRP-like cAMP-binding protein